MRIVQQRSDYFHHALNSLIIAGGSVLLALIIAVPAAWAMAFAPTERTRGTLLWMLSTKMMPPVGRHGADLSVLSRRRVCSTHGPGWSVSCASAICRSSCGCSSPISRKFPKDILEAARMDGATIGKELIYVLTPMAVPGIASTLLLNFILAWNEAFWTLVLTSSNAAPLTAFIASYSSPEGLFWAKLSAASTLAIAPILVLGWFSQRQLVRGLTFGAVK